MTSLKKLLQTTLKQTPALSSCWSTLGPACSVSNVSEHVARLTISGAPSASAEPQSCASAWSVDAAEPLCAAFLCPQGHARVPNVGPCCAGRQTIQSVDQWRECSAQAVSTALIQQQRGYTRRARQRSKPPVGRPRPAANQREQALRPSTARPEGLVEQDSPAEAAVEPRTGPASSTELARIVRHPALIVTRNIEWGTVIIGFEQANKYTILDQDGETVALLAEDSGSFGKEIGRQFLRTRRSFTATIFSPDGQVILRLRRPAYLINSTIYVEDGEGTVVGEVRQRFHVWQRNYDIYLGRRQFAAINSPLLAWEFALRDENGGVLALIDRNFQGFGKELFTDAGKYVIHFGDAASNAAEQAANTVQAAHPDRPRPAVTALARARTDVAVIPTSTGNQLEVARSLDLDERTLALAAAVSIDFDYFSQHSHGSGMMPWMLLPGTGMPPVPYPGAEDAPSEAPTGEGSAPADESGGATEPGSQGAPGGAGGGGFGTEDDWSTQEQDFGEDDNAGWSPDAGGGDGDGEGGASTIDFLRGIFGDDS